MEWSSPTCQREHELCTHTHGIGTDAGHDAHAFLPLNCFTVADCGRLSVEGGQVSYTKAAANRKDTEFGAVANYTCSSGFVLRGNSTSRECLISGSWSGPEPTCGMCNQLFALSFICVINMYDVHQLHVRLYYRTHLSKRPQCSCMLMAVPVTVNAETYYMGTVAMYTCNTGLYLVGEGVRVCLSDGTWSGTEPTCRGEHLFALCLHIFVLFLLDSTW